jgi:hypothetical protein
MPLKPFWVITKELDYLKSIETQHLIIQRKYRRLARIKFALGTILYLQGFVLFYNFLIRNNLPLISSKQSFLFLTLSISLIIFTLVITKGRPFSSPLLTLWEQATREIETIPTPLLAPLQKALISEIRKIIAEDLSKPESPSPV